MAHEFDGGDADPASPPPSLSTRVRDLERSQRVARLGSWYLDYATGDIRWSPEVYEIFGVSDHGPLTIQEFFALVHPEDRELVEAAWAAAEHGAPYNVDHRIVVDGEVLWVRERAIIEFDLDGNPTEADGTVQDITAEYRERHRYRHTLHQAMHGFWRVDHAGTILECNAAASSMLGYKRSELTGMHISNIDVHDSEDDVRGRVEAVRAGARLRFETRHQRADGRLVDVRVSAYPSFDDAQVAIVFTEDITEEKRAKSAHQARIEALEAEAARHRATLRRVLQRVREARAPGGEPRRVLLALERELSDYAD